MLRLCRRALGLPCFRRPFLTLRARRLCLWLCWRLPGRLALGRALEAALLLGIGRSLRGSRLLLCRVGRPAFKR